MKVGLIYDLRNPGRWAEPWSRFYAGFLEHAVRMEQLGFDLIEFPESHFDPDGKLPSPLPMMTAVAMKTTRMLVASDIFVIPNYHPVRLAEDVAILDTLSNGRVVFKAGAGSRDVEAPGFGWPEKDRLGRNTEGLEIIKRCWTEDVFDYHGRHYRLENVRALPKPLQKPHPPIFAPALNPRSMERNARLGYGAAMGAIHSVPNLGEWKSWHADWVQALRRHARTSAECPTSYFLPLWVTDDPERAWNEHKEGILHVAQSYATMMGRPSTVERPEDLPNWQKVFLTPDDSVAFIEEVFGGAAPDQLILWGSRPGMTNEQAERYHRSFMEKVWPRVRDLS